MSEKCALPPPLEAYEIDMYLDGDADDRIIHHLENCTFCRVQAEKQHRVHNKLKAQFYRLSCPSSAELRDYYFQLLPAVQHREITHHLAGCPHCTKEILQDYASDTEFSLEAPKPGLFDQIKMLVAQYMPGPSASLAPAYSAFRDSEAKETRKSKHITVQADGFVISLVIRPEIDDGGLFRLEGQIFEEGDEDLATFEVHLWQNEQLVKTISLDEVGDFLFERLVPGNYTLILSSAEVKIWLPDLDVHL